MTGLLAVSDTCRAHRTHGNFAHRRPRRGSTVQRNEVSTSFLDSDEGRVGNTAQQVVEPHTTNGYGSCGFLSVRPRRILLVAFVLASALGVGLALGPQAGTGDAQLRQQIDRRLLDAGIVGVAVAVREGTATLSGTLTTLWARDEAERITKKVKQIRTVVNSIVVTRVEHEARVVDGVAGELSDAGFLTVFDMASAEVMAGAVILKGYVTSADKAQRLARAVSRVEGVQQIVNRMEVLPASMMDDEIRLLIASRIYSDALYPILSNQATAPVHIIVKSGRVTLMGMVGSEMDRRLAEMLARGVPGVFSVVNSLEVDR